MISVCNHGSLVLVEPDERDHLAFADWLIDNVGDDVTFWGNALVVEPRYAQDLIDGLELDGFEVTA